jgi:dTDP-4-amino-4,6-dideoxygalactose transaminase
MMKRRKAIAHMGKQCLNDLTIFGGRPFTNVKLFVGCPNIGNREQLLRRINDLLDRRQLTNHGPYVEEFEQRVAAFTGARHALAVCNATLGLELAVRALGLSGEVIVPSMTFVATAHALQWHHVTPVFCDIDPETHNLDPRQVERLVTDRTTGVIGVHLWGRPCDVNALAEVAGRHGLRLLFDAAHAFGCSYRGRMVGGFGDAEVFSFHATKMLNSFEGGVLATNDDGLARQVRLMRNFGFAGYDNVVELGTNAKMHEVSAAMGLTSLESFDLFVEVNRRNYHHYRARLAGLPGVRLLGYDEAERCTYQYVVLEIDERVTRVSRDDLVDTLWAENVIARKYFAPGCHNMRAYQDRYPDAALRLLATQRLAERVLVLPTGTAVGGHEIDGICDVLQLAVAEGPRLTALLRARQATGSGVA